MSDPTNPSGDALMKALRDAYGRGHAHAMKMASQPPEKTSEHDTKRDAWIRQYLARMPVAVPAQTVLEDVFGDFDAADYKPDLASAIAAEIMGLKWTHVLPASDDIQDEMKAQGEHCDRYGDVQDVVSSVLDQARTKPHTVAIAAAPVSSNGDGGELERLSAKATSGEWSAEEAGRITAAGTSPGYDIPVWGTILTARDTKDIEAGVTHWATDGERQANARYVAALVNAHRSGKLVLASGSGEEKGTDLVAYLHRQWAWSKETFGPALRTKGIIQHITKELREIEAEPHDLAEWADVIILAMDGFWRHGGKPEDLLPAMQAKQDRNFARTWPDWRTMGEDRAIEHDRTGEAETPEPSPQSSPTLKSGGDRS